MAINSNKYHTNLANYFATQPHFLDGELQKKSHVRKCIEQPWQQTKAELWDDAVNTLENIHFLEAKVIAGMIFRLVEDFREFLQVFPTIHSHFKIIKLLEEALRRDIHFIANHSKEYPQALFQCLWNSCWWYDCPEAKYHYVNQKNEKQRLRSWGNKDLKLYKLIEKWENIRKVNNGNRAWLRSLTPPSYQIGGSMNMVFSGHAEKVNSFAFSPDGNKIVSGSYDKTIRIWDIKTGILTMTLNGHEGDIHEVDVSPNGRYICSGSHDSKIGVWDLNSGVLKYYLIGHDSSVQCVNFSPNGKYIVSGSWDNTIRIWDIENRKEILIIKSHTKCIKSVAFSPNGEHIVSGSDDKEIHINDIKTGKLLRVLRGHESRVNTVSYSVDGAKIISCGGGYPEYDNSVRIWDVEMGNSTHVLTGHSNEVFSVDISPNGRFIASGSLDKTIRIWDIFTGEVLNVIKGHNCWVNCVKFSPNGSFLYSAAGGVGFRVEDNTIRKWNILNRNQQFELKGHTDIIWSIFVSQKHNKILSASKDMTLCSWNINSGRLIQKYIGHKNEVFCSTISSDGKKIASGSKDRSICVWDTKTGQLMKRITTESSISRIIFSSDDKFIIGGSKSSPNENENISLWEVKTGKIFFSFSVFNRYRKGYSISSDGKLEAIGDSSYSIIIRNKIAFEQLFILKGHKSEIQCTAFSQDGKYIASASGIHSNDDNTIRIWSVNTGEPIIVLRGHNEGVTNLAFSTDGNLIASGSYDNSIRIWNLTTGECLQIIEGFSYNPSNGGTKDKLLKYRLGFGIKTCYYYENSKNLWFPAPLPWDFEAYAALQILIGIINEHIWLVKVENDIK